MQNVRCCCDSRICSKNHQSQRMIFHWATFTESTTHVFWLAVSTLWKIWKSVGLLFPTEWEKHVPNHQPFLKPVLIHLQWISWPPNDVRRRCSYCHQRESRMGGWSWPLQTASFRTCEDVIFWVFLQVPSLNDPIWYVFLFFLFPSAPTCLFGVTSWWTPTCFRISQGDVWRFGTRTTLTKTYIHDDCHLILQWILIMC